MTLRELTSGRGGGHSVSIPHRLVVVWRGSATCARCNHGSVAWASDLTPGEDFGVVPDLDPNPADRCYGLAGPEQQQSFCCHSTARARADPMASSSRSRGPGTPRPDGEGD